MICNGTEFAKLPTRNMVRPARLNRFETNTTLVRFATTEAVRFQKAKLDVVCLVRTYK